MRSWLNNLFIALSLLLAPIKPALATAFLLVMVDLVTGLMAARKRKEKITSLGLRRTISKLFIYELLIILSFLTETHLTGDLIPLVKLFAGFVGITELKSVMENLDAISGEPIISKIVDKLTKKENE